jgi:hypothetical protein
MSKSRSGAYHHAHRCMRLWLVFIGLSTYPTKARVVKLKKVEQGLQMSKDS